jgi:AcrR family transcriptional regulator
MNRKLPNKIPKHLRANQAKLKKIRRRKCSSSKSSKRDKILDSAIGLFLQDGYRGTTMKSIADTVNLTEPALYYYFENKSTILQNIRDRIYSDFKELIEKVLTLELDDTQKLRAIISAHSKFVAKNSYILEILFRDRSMLPEYELQMLLQEENALASEIEKVYKNGIKDGSFLNIDPKIATYILLGACNWIMFWYNPHGKLDAEEMSAIVTELLSNGYKRARAKSIN